MTTHDSIQELHHCYCSVTGYNVSLPVHERVFSDFLAHGFTVADLLLVLQWLQRENRRMNGAKFSLRLDRLLDFEYRHFDSLLSEAKAQDRNRVRPKTPKESVLAQWRGTGQTETKTGASARPIRELLLRSINNL